MLVVNDRRATALAETPTEQVTPATDDLFVWDREVPKAWQETLDRLAPPHDKLAHYRLVWEPGEPEAPVQRWVIWQMRPKALTEQLVWTARHHPERAHPKVVGLLEEHPRKNAKWDPEFGGYRKHDGRVAKTDRLTYELYQQTGCLGERFWIVQGDRGGHRWALSQTEKRLLWFATNGLMKDVPFPGDLPYAPFDRRVVKHLLDIERIVMTRKVLQYAEKQEALLDAEEQAEAEQARALYFDWIGEQFAEVADEFRGLYRKILADRPVGLEKVASVTEAEQRDVFIKTGQMVG